jgi:hypothetical protein
LAAQVTKQDFEQIERCGNPDKGMVIDPSGKRNQAYKKAIEAAFFPRPTPASSSGKLDGDTNLFASPEEKKK